MPDTTTPPTPPEAETPELPANPAAAVATDPQAAARLALRRRYPNAFSLRKRARRVLPRFAFEYLDGGNGEDGGIRRNWSALDSVELVPRYGKVESPPPADVTLFGRSYSAPIGIAPMGGPSTVMPGAERHLAAAAQAARVPYTLGVVSALPVETAAELAPDVLWFQLYRFARNEHKIGFDLVRRAEAAGVHVLMLTIDTPVRTTRPREAQTGIVTPFRLTPRLCLDAMRSPMWLSYFMKNGMPKFRQLTPYLGPNPSLAEGAAFMRREQGGAFTWDEIARYRDKWKKPLVLKGVLHPEDAERAVSLGIDGLFVTNHGGRQIDALPAPIDALPAVVEAVGGKASVMLDSGVRSGNDVARAIALGADAAFAGKAFLWSLGALGGRGPAHMLGIFIEEFRAILGQLGCQKVAELGELTVRHPGAYHREDFGARGG